MSSDFSVLATILAIVWLIGFGTAFLTATKAMSCPERLDWLLAFMGGAITVVVTTGFGLLLALCYIAVWIWEHVRVEVTW